MGDYFTLRPRCQAKPFDRIKCGFIRPVTVSGTPATNIKVNLPLPTNSYFFYLMVSVMWPEHSLFKSLHASTPFSRLVLIATFTVIFAYAYLRDIIDIATITSVRYI